MITGANPLSAMRQFYVDCSENTELAAEHKVIETVFSDEASRRAEESQQDTSEVSKFASETSPEHLQNTIAEIYVSYCKKVEKFLTAESQRSEGECPDLEAYAQYENDFTVVERYADALGQKKPKILSLADVKDLTAASYADKAGLSDFKNITDEAKQKAFSKLKDQFEADLTAKKADKMRYAIGTAAAAVVIAGVLTSRYTPDFINKFTHLTGEAAVWADNACNRLPSSAMTTIISNIGLNPVSISELMSSATKTITESPMIQGGIALLAGAPGALIGAGGAAIYSGISQFALSVKDAYSLSGFVGVASVIQSVGPAAIAKVGAGMFLLSLSGEGDTSELTLSELFDPKKREKVQKERHLSNLHRISDDLAFLQASKAETAKQEEDDNYKELFKNLSEVLETNKKLEADSTDLKRRLSSLEEAESRRSSLLDGEKNIDAKGQRWSLMPDPEQTKDSRGTSPVQTDPANDEDSIGEELPVPAEESKDS